MILLFGEILNPFFNIMPDGDVKNVLLILFPYGIMVMIFFAGAVSVFMLYQKTNYYEGGGQR